MPVGREVAVVLALLPAASSDAVRDFTYYHARGNRLDDIKMTTSAFCVNSLITNSNDAAAGILKSSSSHHTALGPGDDGLDNVHDGNGNNNVKCQNFGTKFNGGDDSTGVQQQRNGLDSGSHPVIGTTNATISSATTNNNANMYSLSSAVATEQSAGGYANPWVYCNSAAESGHYATAVASGGDREDYESTPPSGAYPYPVGAQKSGYHSAAAAAAEAGYYPFSGRQGYAAADRYHQSHYAAAAAAAHTNGHHAGLSASLAGTFAAKFASGAIVAEDGRSQRYGSSYDHYGDTAYHGYAPSGKVRTASYTSSGGESSNSPPPKETKPSIGSDHELCTPKMEGRFFIYK